jgi:hypothetical protein
MPGALPDSQKVSHQCQALAFFFVGGLPAGITDNSAIHSTSIIQDKISLGSQEMQKAREI